MSSIEHYHRLKPHLPQSCSVAVIPLFDLISAVHHVPSSHHFTSIRSSRSTNNHTENICQAVLYEYCIKPESTKYDGIYTVQNPPWIHTTLPWSTIRVGVALSMDCSRVASLARFAKPKPVWLLLSSTPTLRHCRISRKIDLARKP